MKAIFRTVLLIGLLSFNSANAGLKDDMKQISDIFKTIAGQFNDASLNTESADLAGQLVTLFTAALNEVPPSIANLSGPDRDTAIMQFKDLIQQEIDLSTELQKAFLAGDNAGALVILKKINTIRGEGHNAFNPPK
jgi:hypothetical protein